MHFTCNLRVDPTILQVILDFTKKKKMQLSLQLVSSAVNLTDIDGV